MARPMELHPDYLADTISVDTMSLASFEEEEWAESSDSDRVYSPIRGDEEEGLVAVVSPVGLSCSGTCTTLLTRL